MGAPASAPAQASSTLTLTLTQPQRPPPHPDHRPGHAAGALGHTRDPGAPPPTRTPALARHAPPRPRCLVTVGPPSKRRRRRPRVAGSAGRVPLRFPAGLPDSTCPKSMLPRPPQQSGPATELLMGSAPGPRSSPRGTPLGGPPLEGPLGTSPPPAPGPAPLRPGSAACRGAFPVTPTSPGSLGNVVSRPRDAPLSWSARAGLSGNENYKSQDCTLQGPPLPRRNRGRVRGGSASRLAPSAPGSRSRPARLPGLPSWAGGGEARGQRRRVAGISSFPRRPRGLGPGPGPAPAPF